MTPLEGLAALIRSARVVDLILALLLLETLLIIAWRLYRRRASGWLGLTLGCAPGLCLLLALRTVLSGGDWRSTGLWLTAAFPAHLADLWHRRP